MSCGDSARVPPRSGLNPGDRPALRLAPLLRDPHEADARIDRLNERVGETMLERGDDGVDLLGDAVGDVDEGRQAGAQGPLDPLLEEFQGILEGELEEASSIPAPWCSAN